MLNLLESNRFLQVKATYYNPRSKKKINTIVKDYYTPMALRESGKCFKLGVSKEAMPYNVYTYGNVTMGACSIQPALDMPKDDDKQKLLDNLEKWDCTLGKGMDSQMFDFMKFSSIYCKPGCEILMDGYEILRQWML